MLEPLLLITAKITNFSTLFSGNEIFLKPTVSADFRANCPKIRRNCPFIKNLLTKKLGGKPCNVSAYYKILKIT